MLTPEQILQPDELTPQNVPVPEWGGDGYYVAQLTADQRDQCEVEWQALGGGDVVGFRAFLVAYCLCDESNNRFYADNVGEAAKALGVKDARPVTRLFDAAVKKNGFSDSDVEELEKN